MSAGVEAITPPSSSTLAVEEVATYCVDRCQPVRAALLFCVSNVIDRSTKKYFPFRRKKKLAKVKLISCSKNKKNVLLQ